MGKGEIPDVEIVGVVHDSKYFSLRDSHDRMMYLSNRQDVGHLTEMCIAVRTAGDPSSLAAAIRSELRNIDKNLPVPRIDTAAEQVDATLVEDRLVTLLLRLFRGARLAVGVSGPIWRPVVHGGAQDQRDRNPVGARREARRRAGHGAA
jgi:hypothetical protein